MGWTRYRPPGFTRGRSHWRKVRRMEPFTSLRVEAFLEEEHWAAFEQRPGQGGKRRFVSERERHPRRLKKAMEQVG